jgi:DNA-binding transcriptional ArsR family regulator
VAGEATVGEVAAPLAMALPSVSKHVRLLERSGLITRRVEGRHHWLRLSPDGLRTAGEYLDLYRPFWTQSIDRLARLTASLADAQVGTDKGTGRTPKGRQEA